MNKIVYLIALIAFVACKSNETPSPDFANGTYQMSADVSYRNNGTVTKQPGSGRLSVSRTGADILEFTEDYGGYYRKYSVRIKGSSISIVDNSTESLRVGSQDITCSLSGNGVIASDGKSLNLNTVSVGNQSGVSVTKSAFITGQR